MAGDIEEPFRHSFQADSWQSGSISFGRFENESLCWERRSSFTHNRYLEEVEKYSKPGSVTEKKAYFEARLRKKALLRQSSSEWQNGTESQVSENDGHENTSYEGDFKHVNEIGHSARFAENHDRSANLLEKEKYSENDVTENEGSAGEFEHVNEDGHSAQFDENIDRSIHLLKNGKYQAENTGYDGDFERVNDVGHSAHFEESLDGSHNGDIEITECGGEDSIILHSGPQTEQATNSSDVLQSVPEHMEAEPNFHLNAGNSAFDDDPKTEIEVKVKLEGKDSSMEFSSNSVDLSSNAHTTENGSVSSEPQRSSSSKVRTASQSRDTKARMLPQVSVASGKGTISKQAYKDMPSKPNRRHSDVSFTRKGEKPRLDAPGALLRSTARMPKSEVCSGSKVNVLNQQKSTEQQPKARKAAAFRDSCTEKVSHRVHQSVNRDKQSVNSCQPGMKQNGSGFLFKSEERAKKRKEFLMKLEEKMHAVEAEKHQLQARTQVKKEAELKQLRRNLNFKATPMPAFYHEPGRRSDRNKELASKTKSSKSQSRPSTSGARAISATENTVPCSTSEHINMADSPQVSEVTNHPSAELSDSSVPSSAPTNKTSWQTRSNRTVAPKREQEKWQVLNSPRPRTADTNKGNKGFKAEEKTKVVARRSIGNNAMRKDIRSIDLSRSTRVGRLAVGVAS
ncbi:hypothetical protein H5410_025497 [Solanum commersonii]|uniref:TPX2 C-terminal domain-containing protein n=1 Tax=Solanum commersonii TaxID=4109 RepID=A0A9J5YVY8_SOLCO|nr:hypothetical protein H5410_025497 [Solanum commersonii]